MYINMCVYMHVHMHMHMHAHDRPDHMMCGTVRCKRKPIGNECLTRHEVPVTEGAKPPQRQAPGAGQSAPLDKQRPI